MVIGGGNCIACQPHGRVEDLDAEFRPVYWTLGVQCNCPAKKICDLWPDELIEGLKLSGMHAARNRGHRPLSAY